MLDQLAQIGDNWDEVEEMEGIGEVPDGNYAVRIDEAVINNAKTSERLQVSFKCTIAEGEYAGRNIWKHDGIADERGLSFMRTTLARLGFDWPASPSELPDTLADLVGMFAAVTCKTRAGNDIQNVYFNKPLEDFEADIPEADDDAPEIDEDEDEDTEGGGRFAAGDRVQVTYDDGDYPGEVVSYNDDGTILVIFDDDTEEDVAEDACRPEATEESEGDDDAEEAEGDGDEDDAPTVTFTDDDIGTSHEKRIGAIAEANEYNPDDYDTWSALVLDLLGYFGIAGEFEKPLAAIKALETAQKEG